MQVGLGRKHESTFHSLHPGRSKESTIHRHCYTTIKHSTSKHWYECVCGGKSREENHKGGIATCTILAKCEVCSQNYGDLKPHEHTTLKHTTSKHWYECVCGDKSGEENHKGGTATCIKLARCSICDQSYGNYAEHIFNIQNTNFFYLYKPASCEVKASYFYSCSCGEKGKEHFEYGQELGHSFTNYVSNNNATYENDGTKTAVCDRDGCDEEHTIIDSGIMLQSYLTFKTLSQNQKKIVTNATENFSFKDEISVVGICTYQLAKDIDGLEKYSSDVIPLDAGDNTVYVLEIFKGTTVNVYRFTIRRRPIYTVTIIFGNGQKNKVQQIEESYRANTPTTPENPGYAFDGWDFNFNSPITDNVTITAKWTELTDTPYKVQYYLQNMRYSGYTMYEQESFTGTTGEVVTATIKTFDYFTYIPNKGTQSAEIKGDGSTVLKVYYSRNKYVVNVSGINNKGTVSGSGTYSNEQGITLVASLNEGYIFTGWFDGDNLISSSATYKLNPTKNIDIVGVWTASTNIPYKVEYYQQNTDNGAYTLKEYEILYGTTDTNATYTIKSYPHFTIKNADETVNINGNGLSVVRLYYNRNVYSVSVKCDNAELVTLGCGNYYNEQTVQLIIKAPLGYDFIGLYNGSQLISSATTYSFNPTAHLNLTAKVQVKEEMKLFNFTSTENTCTITGTTNTSVTSIVIPNYITTIASNAFSGCSLLQSVSMGSSVTKIEANAFSNCSKLTYTTKSNLKYLKDSNNALYLIGVSSTSLTSATIDSNCKVIADSAFINCSALTSITIPNSVTSIGANAFAGCTKLNYNVKNNLKYLGNSSNKYLYLAGADVNTLTSISIEYYCKIIGESAFYNYSSLISIDLPSTLISIGASAFYGCSALTKVNYRGEIDKWVEIEFTNSYSNPIYYAENLYLNDELVTTARFTNATKISNYALYNCKSLLNTKLSSGITSIGLEAFRGCSNLTNVLFEENCTLNRICEGAFYDCKSLMEIIIPYSVARIENNIFYGCTSLNNIYCEAQSKPNSWNSAWLNNCSSSVCWQYVQQDKEGYLEDIFGGWEL